MTLPEALASFEEMWRIQHPNPRGDERIMYPHDYNDLKSFITEVWLASRESALEEAIGAMPELDEGLTIDDRDAAETESDWKYWGEQIGWNSYRATAIEYIRALKK